MVYYSKCQLFISSGYIKSSLYGVCYCILLFIVVNKCMISNVCVLLWYSIINSSSLSFMIVFPIQDVSSVLTTQFAFRTTTHSSAHQLLHLVERTVESYHKWSLQWGLTGFGTCHPERQEAGEPLVYQGRTCWSLMWVHHWSLTVTCMFIFIISVICLRKWLMLT